MSLHAIEESYDIVHTASLCTPVRSHAPTARYHPHPEGIVQSQSDSRALLLPLQDPQVPSQHPPDPTTRISECTYRLPQQLLVFTKVPVSDSSAASSALHVDTESYDVIELKPGCYTTGRSTGIPHVYAQIFAQLYCMLTASVLKSLKKCGQAPNGITCHALLISEVHPYVFFTLKIQIGQYDSSELTFDYSSINKFCSAGPSQYLDGNFLCSAIMKLLSYLEFMKLVKYVNFNTQVRFTLIKQH